MRYVLVLIPLVVVAALFAVFASQIGRDPNFVPSALINKPVPEFTLAKVETLPQPGFATADLKGNGVSVVNVWGSWCGPCRIEHPMLMRLATRNDITLYGINQNDPPENAKRFLDELGNPFDAVGSDRDRRASIDWGVYGVPETFVVNNEGVITYKHTGPISEQSYANSLIPAIEAAKTGATSASASAGS